VNLSALFIRRPIGTILLTAGIAIAGIFGFFVLPVAPLPQVDYPVISVNASLAGASPETMATSVATPLERRLGTISDINEITSRSSTSNSRITLQFNLERDIDSAAREVQAAINAARGDLPSTLRQNPTYSKANPSDSPIIVLALTSPTRSPSSIYDAVANVIQQKLAQVHGVGDVEIGGSSLPAVRVNVAPFSLTHYGIGMEDVRAAIQAANATRPKGAVEGDGERLQVYTDTPGRVAADYRRLVIAWKDGAAVRLGDVAEVTDGPADERTMGLFNGQPAVIVLLRPTPGANIIETVDQVKALVPELSEALPDDIKLSIASDRTHSIRASLHEIEFTLVLSIVLVILVVSAFLRNTRATAIPAVATIVSLLGTFGVMVLLGFSLNNLSLMALTVATGFVVDDAIVVLENTSRHIESGMNRVQAALLGAREVGFTVLSISVSLVAVFIPLLFMGGQVGRLFREFAVTLSVAVLISLVISLTTTPMLCALLLRPRDPSKREGRIARAAEATFDWMRDIYASHLDVALRWKGVVLLILLGVITLNVWLFVKLPKGFFPEQDSGQMVGMLNADQSISFQSMSQHLRSFVDIIRKDPAVDTVIAFTGGRRSNGGFMFVSLKPADQRDVSARAVIARLRPQLAQVPGVSIFLNPTQDLRMGARESNATYQYTLKGDNADQLKTWSAKLARAMGALPQLEDVDSDQRNSGVETFVTIDRSTAARFGIGNRDIDNALYSAFGQRAAATIYDDVNQYSVVLQVAPRYAQGPEALNGVYVPARNVAAVNAYANPALRDASGGSALATSSNVAMVPLSAIASFSERSAATEVNHQDASRSTTISFNLADGVSLGDAAAAIRQAEADIGLPASINAGFAGTALAAQQSSSQQPLLILSAIVVIYIVLGILYESYVHPITVLSTLPSAGFGAVLALLLLNMEFSVIALIGIFLLIGIVKKNAILIIDFALEAERSRGLSPLEAVREACVLRFRPILMTTMAAALGALPLAIGLGEGYELRQPLGVAIIGGLIASQLLTLLTTPVVYLYLDKLRWRGKDERHLSHLAGQRVTDAH